MESQDLEQNKELLRKKIEDCNLVITNLETNPGFLRMLEDFGTTKKMLDESWHLIRDKQKLEELQITKLAVMSVINALDNYRHDKNMAAKQLFEFENPELVQAGDYSQEKQD